MQPGPEELALRLQLRLQRLGAMREAGARLMARDRLGRDVFARGAPEGLEPGAALRAGRPACSLIQAYGQVQHRNRPVVHMVRERPVMTLEAALARISAMLGTSLEWRDLRAFLPPTLTATQTGNWRARRWPPAFWPRWNWPSRAWWIWCRKNALARCWSALPAAAMSVPDDLVRAVEATLFAAQEPLPARRSRAILAGGRALALDELARHYAGRGVHLVERGGRWHFQTAPDLAHLLRRERTRCAACRARRPRRWRSSPITSRSAAPRSRPFAACRPRAARSTC
jgi:hypothetical protein